MRTLPDTPSTTVQNDVFDALAHPRRRAILRVLERVTRVRPAALAALLVAEETDTPLIDVARSEAEPVLLDLEHRHLPRLSNAGLLSLEDGLVTTSEHPALEDPKVDAMVGTDGPDWDAVLANLADRCRRVVLSTLSTNGAPMDRAELAAAVAERLGDDAVAAEDVHADLYHVHLPKLEAAGLVSSDAGDGTVDYEGHPALDERWLVAGVSDTPRAILASADRSAGSSWPTARRS